MDRNAVDSLRSQSNLVIPQLESLLNTMEALLAEERRTRSGPKTKD
jgi:hypothetical protein